MPIGARHHFTSWLPGITMTWLTRRASRRKARARRNSPARERCDRSPDTATTSKCRSAIIASIASISSGTAGLPKCRSDTCRTVVVTATTALPVADEIGEMLGHTRRKGGREGRRGVALDVHHPANLRAARVEQDDTNHRTLHSRTGGFETDLDRTQYVLPFVLHGDQRADLRTERLRKLRRHL